MNFHFDLRSSTSESPWLFDYISYYNEVNESASSVSGDGGISSSNSSSSGGIDSLELRSTGIGTFKIVLITIISFICVLLNCGTIAVIFQPRRIRPVNYLIANLSIISIISSIAINLYFGELFVKGIWLCGLLTFIRNLSISVMSLTVLGISFERVRSLKSHTAKVLIPRTLFCIWGISILLNIPIFFTTKYVEKSEEKFSACKQVPLLGNVAVNISYEVLRFLVFHVAVCIYMMFELYEVRSKMKYMYLFKTIPSRKLRRKVQRVRFVYIYSLTFISIWIPFGAVLSFYRSLTRTLQTEELSYLKKYPILLGVLATFFYGYILVTPMIILWTNEDLSKRCTTSQKSTPVDKSEMSLQATMAKTPESQHSPYINNLPKIKVTCNIIVTVSELHNTDCYDDTNSKNNTMDEDSKKTIDFV